MKIKYSVVIPARNEARSIAYTIRSLKRQYLKPAIIVVVDDSSCDETASIAEKEGAYVIRIERKSRASATGTPYLAFVINQGLRALKRLDLDFVMISGAESVYPRNYAYDLVRRMIRDRVVVASGIAAGEKTLGTLSVRGSGRMIDAGWFHKVGFQYPLHYGFETWLLLKALKTGFKVATYKEIVFYQIRKTSMGPKKAYLYGKAMKALDYPALYVVGRIMKTLIQYGGIYAKYMAIGYLRGAQKYRDVAGMAKHILLHELIATKTAKKILFKSSE